MTYSLSTIRKHWLAFAATVILLAVALAAGTLFAANERQDADLFPSSEQVPLGGTDPGFATDPPALAAKAEPEPPLTEPDPGAGQVAPDSDALTQWLADQPETMGFITEEDAITADPDTMDWLLYQAVYKGVLTQEEADAVQNWYGQRPSTVEAPELLDHQPGYLYRPDDEDVTSELFRETESR